MDVGWVPSMGWDGFSDTGVGWPAQDMPGHIRRSIYPKRLGRGQNRYGGDADRGVLDGIHIGAIWRIRLNRPCAAAMPLYVK